MHEEVPVAPVLITAAEAALYTGRPVGTIWRWASEGRITRHGRGKAVRYNLHELPHASRDEATGELRLGEPPQLPAGQRAA